MELFIASGLFALAVGNLINCGRDDAQDKLIQDLQNRIAQLEKWK